MWYVRISPMQFLFPHGFYLLILSFIFPIAFPITLDIIYKVNYIDNVKKISISYKMVHTMLIFNNFLRSNRSLQKLDVSTLSFSIFLKIQIMLLFCYQMSLRPLADSYVTALQISDSQSSTDLFGALMYLHNSLILMDSYGKKIFWAIGYCSTEIFSTRNYEAYLLMLSNSQAV